MKRIMILLACVFSLCLLCGCGGTEHTLPPEESAAPEAEEALTKDQDGLFRLPASPYNEHVFSHQGSAIEEKSETFAAYDLVIAYGSRYIENDLQLSADGVLYASHDNSPEALTGETRLFSEMSAEEIDSLRTEGDGQCIPRLSAIFDRYGTAVDYVIELKAGASVVDPFLELVREAGMQDHIIVQSWSVDTLAKIEEIWPDMPKLLLLDKEEGFDKALESECVDIIGVNGLLFTQEYCDRTHEAEKQFCVYNLNASASIRRAIEMGADCYFTDFTAKALLLESMYRK